MQIPLAAFKAASKAAQLFSPLKIQEMQPDCAAVDSLSVFPFLDYNTLGDLKTELPHYMAAVEDISPTYSPLEVWKRHALSTLLGPWQQERSYYCIHHQLLLNVFSHY